MDYVNNIKDILDDQTERPKVNKFSYKGCRRYPYQRHLTWNRASQKIWLMRRFWEESYTQI